MVKKNIRSADEIEQSLLAKAFNRGGEDARQEMQERINDLRQESRKANQAALDLFEERYKVAEFNADDICPVTRGVGAINFISHIDGKAGRLKDQFLISQAGASEQEKQDAALMQLIEQAENRGSVLLHPTAYSHSFH